MQIRWQGVTHGFNGKGSFVGPTRRGNPPFPKHRSDALGVYHLDFASGSFRGPNPTGLLTRLAQWAESAESSEKGGGERVVELELEDQFCDWQRVVPSP